MEWPTNASISTKPFENENGGKFRSHLPVFWRDIVNVPPTFAPCCGSAGYWRSNPNLGKQRNVWPTVGPCWATRTWGLPIWSPG